MRQRLYLSLVCLFYVSLVFSQQPDVVSQSVIGANNEDTTRVVINTSDGGQLIAGYSRSNISGDKTENSLGSYDYWVLKLDSNGAIQWQNTIGGDSEEEVLAALETPDGGYIIGGNSRSNASGDKSEDHMGGVWDYWIVKLDSNGMVVWENTIGTEETEHFTSLALASDGGYIVSGMSSGGISGDKTDHSWGSDDYWILKLNLSGDIVWQKTIGGNMADAFPVVKATSDGGYILGGHSGSGISGNKTEPHIGYIDYWVVKIDVNGNVQWDNTIGGTRHDNLFDLMETSNGGYLIGGYSDSDISADKTENSQGTHDYWVLKLNANGAIVWQNTIGGEGIDRLTRMAEDENGNYFIAGYSESNTSGDKTEDSRGLLDYWLVKLAPHGAIQWDKTIGGSEHDFLFSIAFSEDNTIRLGGGSYSGVSGDKDVPSHGGTDIWLVNLNNLLEVNDTGLNSSIGLYPNPTQDVLFISSEEEIQETKIFTVKGDLIQTVVTDDTFRSIDVSGLPNGVYFLQITSEGKTATKQFIKE